MISTSVVATKVESARAFAEQFGPVHDVRYLAAAAAAQVELDETADVQTLLVFHAVLRNAHTRAGVYTKADEYVRLHLRGTLDEIGPVIVTLPFHRARRAQQARMAWDWW